MAYNTYLSRAFGIAMALIVTLEVFSGRPNPEWTLTAQQSIEFERRLAALAPLTIGAVGREQPLGYHGLSVRGRGTTVRIFRGQVMNGNQLLADTGRGLERWLLDTGRGSIDPELGAYVASEISSGPN